MVFGFGKKKKDTRRKTQGVLGELRADDLLADGREKAKQLDDIPEGIAPGDAPKWRKLQKLLEEHASFKLQTFDGLYWLDPFSGEFVSAPFDLKATIVRHFADNHHWMGGKLKPYKQLVRQVWQQYLEENLDSDQRFVLFLDDGRWYDPWAKEADPQLRLEHLDDREAFVKAVAGRMAGHEGANPRDMLGLENLKKVMLGIELEPEDEDDDDDPGGIRGVGGKEGIAAGGLKPVQASENLRAETEAEIERQRTAARTRAAEGRGDAPVIEGDDSFGASFAAGGGGERFKLDLAGHGGAAPSNEQIFQMMQQLIARMPAVSMPAVAAQAPGGQLSNQALYQSMQQIEQQIQGQEGPEPAAATGDAVLPELSAGSEEPSGNDLLQALQHLQERIDGIGGSAAALGGTPAAGGPVVVPGAAAAAGQYRLAPGALPPPEVAGRVSGSIGGSAIPPGSVVIPAAQQLFDGLFSLRDTQLSRDEEEAQAGAADQPPGGGAPGQADATRVPSDSFHLPGNVPVMQQNQISPDLIQKLVDSLQKVSLVASSVAETKYQPATKGGSASALTERRRPEEGAADDAFAAADSEGPPEEEAKPQVSTAAFIDPESDLDIDRVFASLQAREARGDDDDSEDAAPGLDDTDDFGMSTIGLDDDEALEEFGVEVEEEEEEEEDFDDHAEDMAKAVTVQNHLLGGIPALDGVAIALHYVPYSEIGGDFYNVLKIDDERFFFIVGDVSGHGVQAALIVSSVVNTLRIIFREREDWELLDILAELNGYMRECLMTGQFITAFAGIIRTGPEPSIDCACAGHHPSICLNHGTEQPLRELGGKGMGIGLVRSSVFRQNTNVQREALRSGDMICIYTDGIVEVNDEYGEELGDNFARNSFIAHMDEPLENLIDTVIGDIMSESDGTIADDQTVMVIRVL